MAFNDGDMSRYDGVNEQLRNLQKAHQNAEISRHIDFLKHAASLLIGRYLELGVPKVKLLSKTVNIISLPAITNHKPKAEPDSISTIATGWVLNSKETEFEKSDSVETVHSGYLINKSRTIFGFNNGELAVASGKTSYTVSEYSEEYLSMTRDIDNINKPYLDIDEAVIGEINRLSYHNGTQRSVIESILASAAINQGLEKKILSTWQPMIYNQD